MIKNDQVFEVYLSDVCKYGISQAGTHLAEKILMLSASHRLDII
jgi:hypothetical protein